MRITEVRIKLCDEAGAGNERLIAFASVTFDDAFVVRDLKVIEGAKGRFVAMPSRKLTDRCPNGCGTKNHLRARYCNQCGGCLDEFRAVGDGGKAKLHSDVAHPIRQEMRALIEGFVLAAYDREVELAKRPGYVPAYDVPHAPRRAIA